MSIKQSKIIILGSAGVGKTSLVTRLMTNQFDQTLSTTLGAAYFQKIHNYGDNNNKDKSIKFQFWDTAGQQKFRSIARIYYKDAKAAILMYDVSDSLSYDGMKIWLEQLKQKGPQNLILMIVGNKIDKLQHQVSANQVQQYAKLHNALFKLISVKENKSIDQLFDSLAFMLDRQNGNSGNKQKADRLSKINKKNRDQNKGCC